MKILVYGYGNPGRQDDGLGNMLVDRMREWAKKNDLKDISFDSNYQLNIEDAHEIMDKDIAIFVDATMENVDSFCVTKVNEIRNVSFTTHAASPGYIYGLCKKLFGKVPHTYLMHIKGYKWEFQEEATDKALQNLEEAFDYLKQKISDNKIKSEPDILLKNC